jgi:hypothetical protein
MMVAMSMNLKPVEAERFCNHMQRTGAKLQTPKRKRRGQALQSIRDRLPAAKATER